MEETGQDADNLPSTDEKKQGSSDLKTTPDSDIGKECEKIFDTLTSNLYICDFQNNNPNFQCNRHRDSSEFPIITPLLRSERARFQE